MLRWRGALWGVPRSDHAVRGSTPRCRWCEGPWFGIVCSSRGGTGMRMIERWFPCAEVSEQSGKGWGTGNSEKALFTWFAARPLAQAKAAVLTSLLPWPDDEAE